MTKWLTKSNVNEENAGIEFDFNGTNKGRKESQNLSVFANR